LNKQKMVHFQGKGTREGCGDDIPPGPTPGEQGWLLKTYEGGLNKTMNWSVGRWVVGEEKNGKGKEPTRHQQGFKPQKSDESRQKRKGHHVFWKGTKKLLDQGKTRAVEGKDGCGTQRRESMRGKENHY